MQQLKKVGAISGALVLVACWPLAVGQIAQNVLKDGIKALDNENFSSEIVSYDRGYLSSVATTRYIIKDAALKEQFIQDGLPTEFMLRHNIKHGLIQVATETQFVHLDAVPATLSTITQLNGNTEFNLEIDNINYQVANDPGTTLYLAPSSVKGNSTVLGQIDLSFTFPLIHVHFDSGESLNISSMTGFVTGKKINGFWHGEQKIAIADSALLLSDGTVFSSAKDFSYKFNSSIDEASDRLNTNHIIKSGNMVSNQLELSALNVDFTLAQLDKESFEGLIGLYQSNPIIDENVLAQSAPFVDQLFSRGFDVSLNEFKFSIGKGKFNSRWLFEIPQGTDRVTQDFSKVIPALKGKLSSYVSNELINTSPYMQEGVDEMVIMEIIQPSASGYKMDATLADGNLKFASGQKIPLVAMFMSMMMR